MKQSDLAHKEYWDEVYDALTADSEEIWQPRGYEERVIGAELAQVIRSYQPQSVLEIGCGNSPWLPYLANEYDLAVTGIDYSERGCELARNRLQQASIEGTIHCRDIFGLIPEEIGTFDMVYSLGVVEHFSDLEHILKQQLEFVRPGGILFASVPNLYSIHGLGMWLYQPEVLNKHRIVTRQELLDVYQSCGLQQIKVDYAGLASVGIVSRGVSPRFPLIDGLLTMLAEGANSLFQVTMKHAPVSSGLPWVAPFIVAAGRKMGHQAHFEQG